MKTTLGRKENDREIRKTKEAQQILLIQHLLNHGEGSTGFIMPFWQLSNELKV